MPRFRWPPAPLVLALAAAFAAPLVGAQAPSDAAPAAASHALDLPAQPLGDALNALARQLGLQVAVQQSWVQGRTAPALQGRYGAQEALDRLLAGSGLRGRVAGRTLEIEAIPPAAEARLGTVTVVANQLGEITEGSGSYTPSAIATATRIVLSPRETPQSISVVTRQQIEDFNLTSIDDVMRHTPGVSIVTYDSERTVYLSRGFAINNFQYDGIPMRRNSAYSAGNTLSDTAIYDRVETLKGATGLLTGSGEPGATINLVRKRPTAEFQGQVNVGIGSWDSYRGMVDVGGPLNPEGTVRARAVASYQTRHSELDHYRRETMVFYGIVEAQVTPDTLLSLGADYQDNDPRGSTWGGIPIYDSNGNFNGTARSFNPGTRWSNWEQRTRTLFSTIEHGFDNGWIAKLQLNHQLNGYDAQLGSIGSGNPNPADGSGTSLWTGQYIGQTISNAADIYASGPVQLFGRKHELVIGASAAKRHWRGEGRSPQVGYDTDVADFYRWDGRKPDPDWSNPSWQGQNDETVHERGLYSAFRLNPRDDLKLILGARVSSYKSPGIKEDSVFVPYAGAIYDLNDSFSVYASYTDIFLPQSERDVSGNTLDPQTGRSIEGGLKAEFFNGRLNGSVAVFRIQQDNVPFAVGLSPTGETAYRAEKGIVTRGYEAEISGRVLPGWQLSAGYTHRVSRQHGEKVSTEDPEDQFMFNTAVTLPGDAERWTVGGGARWQSKTWADVWFGTGERNIEQRVDARWLADAMARYRFDDRLSATLNVRNLFDKKYYSMMSFYSTYSWGEGRSYNLSLDYRF